jgi:hypothetical protein
VDVKFFRKTKFPAKVLLWLMAVGENGISEPVFFNAGLAVNKEVWISKCLLDNLNGVVVRYADC